MYPPETSHAPESAQGFKKKNRLCLAKVQEGDVAIQTLQMRKIGILFKDFLPEQQDRKAVEKQSELGFLGPKTTDP